MKRLLSLLLILVCTTPVLGMSYWTLTVDNSPVPAELPPVPVGEGTLLVSARALCQALHATYDYDQVSGRIRVSRNGTVVEMRESLPEATVNGRAVRMPVPARRESGAMMLPVPFIAEILGWRAAVDGKAQTMSLTAGGAASSTVATSAPTAQQPAAAQPTTPGGFIAPADATPAQKSVPSALPWLASGTLPPAPGFPQPVGGSIPQMPAVAVQPVVLGASVPTIGSQPPPSMNAGQGMTLPTIGAQPVPALPAGSGMQIPTIHGPNPSAGSSGVQLPPDAYQENARVAPGDRQLPTTRPETPWNDTAVTKAGTMDEIRTSGEIDVFNMPEDPQNPRPDPSITGLTLERRFDQFVNAYVVRYRISNLGYLSTDKPITLRLSVGGRGELKTVQDIRVERLAPGQSLNFEWTGDARQYPGLYDIVVRAQVQAIMDDDANDENKKNNTRTVRLAY